MVTGLPGSLGGQLGLVAETTYNTLVTVSKFFEFDSENIKPKITQFESRGHRGQQVLAAARVYTKVIGAAGPVKMDVPTKGFGIWLQHMLGTNTITGASANKTHTCTLAATGQRGKFMTMQVGRSSSPDGTIHPFTWGGGKIMKWSLESSVDKNLAATFDMDFASETNATALASASYPTAYEMLNFDEAVLTIDGNAYFCTNFKMAGDGKLVASRRGAGNAKREPIAGDLYDISGSLGGEFEALDLVALSRSGAPVALTATFTSPTVIPTTIVPYSLAITVPNIQITEADPVTPMTGLLPLPLNYRMLRPTSGEPVTMVYTTADTVP